MSLLRMSAVNLSEFMDCRQYLQDFRDLVDEIILPHIQAEIYQVVHGGHWTIDITTTRWAKLFAGENAISRGFRAWFAYHLPAVVVMTTDGPDRYGQGKYKMTLEVRADLPADEKDLKNRGPQYKALTDLILMTHWANSVLKDEIIYNLYYIACAKKDPEGTRLARLDKLLPVSYVKDLPLNAPIRSICMAYNTITKVEKAHLDKYVYTGGTEDCLHIRVNAVR